MVSITVPANGYGYPDQAGRRITRVPIAGVCGRLHVLLLDDVRHRVRKAGLRLRRIGYVSIVAKLVVGGQSPRRRGKLGKVVFDILNRIIGTVEGQALGLLHLQVSQGARLVVAELSPISNML